jgi:hypothetical protein
MAKRLEWDGRGNILDPCVGAGNLLLGLIEVYGEKVIDYFYGIDILPENIKYCQDTWPNIKNHFQLGNCLIDDFTDDNFWKKEAFSKNWTPSPKKFKFGIN